MPILATNSGHCRPAARRGQSGYDGIIDPLMFRMSVNSFR
jgi:hypothetical protein